MFPFPSTAAIWEWYELVFIWGTYKIGKTRLGWLGTRTSRVHVFWQWRYPSQGRGWATKCFGTGKWFLSWKFLPWWMLLLVLLHGVWYNDEQLIVVVSKLQLLVTIVLRLPFVQSLLVLIICLLACLLQYSPSDEFPVPSLGETFTGTNLMSCWTWLLGLLSVSWCTLQHWKNSMAPLPMTNFMTSS